MPRQKSWKPKDRKDTKLESTARKSNERSSGASESDSDDPMEKDETELELEKLVFGDDAGFQEGLKSYRTDVGTLDIPEDGTENIQSEGLSGIVQDLEVLNDADLFFVDSGPSIQNAQSLVLAPSRPNEEDDSDGDNPPAWVDSDDERLTVSLASHPRLRKLRLNEADDIVNGREYTKRLRQQFERLYPVPEWANPTASKKSASRQKRRRTSDDGSSSEESSDDNMSVDSGELSTQPLAKLLQSAGALIQSSLTTTANLRKIRPEVIDIQRTKDVGGVQPSAITTLSFHPQSPLLLSAGPSSLLSLFHISPTTTPPNPTLTTLALPHHPIHSCAFAPQTGSRIFLSSRRRYFHIWDLTSGAISKVSRIYGHADEQRTMERFKLSPCGRWMGLVGSGRKGGGTINILDANTGQWACQARVDGRGGVADFAWWSDGAGMVVLGKGGNAIEYCISQKAVVARWTDDGAVGTTVVTLGGPQIGNHSLGGDRWIAVGSSSGIVNVYDRSTWKRDCVPEHPKPTRVFDQLVTAISHLTISPDGQLLVMASRWKRDALRLVHLPTCTVYKNWPTAATPFGRITAVAMSPNSELLAVGNEQGKIRLWEIRS